MSLSCQPSTGSRKASTASSRSSVLKSPTFSAKSGNLSDDQPVEEDPVNLMENPLDEVGLVYNILLKTPAVYVVTT